MAAERAAHGRPRMKTLTIVCPACIESISVEDGMLGHPIVCPHANCNSTILLKRNRQNQLEVVSVKTLGCDVVCPECSHMFEIPVPQLQKMGLCPRCHRLMRPTKVLNVCCARCLRPFRALDSWMYGVRCPRCGDIKLAYDSPDEATQRMRLETMQNITNAELIPTGMRPKVGLAAAVGGCAVLVLAGLGFLAVCWLAMWALRKL
jgi:ssDNA-binding Zn-finger/Zn-ribbon topoisomerase 1